LFSPPQDLVQEQNAEEDAQNQNDGHGSSPVHFAAGVSMRDISISFAALLWSKASSISSFRFLCPLRNSLAGAIAFLARATST